MLGLLCAASRARAGKGRLAGQQSLQSGKYSRKARSEVSFPPFKTQIRPKIKKIVSEGPFDVFTVQNRTPRLESVQIKVLKQFFVFVFLFFSPCELF